MVQPIELPHPLDMVQPIKLAHPFDMVQQVKLAHTYPFDMVQLAILVQPAIKLAHNISF